MRYEKNSRKQLRVWRLISAVDRKCLKCDGWEEIRKITMPLIRWAIREVILGEYHQHRRSLVQVTDDLEQRVYSPGDVAIYDEGPRGHKRSYSAHSAQV